MKIWIDADACPKPIKEIVYKASVRLKIELILVANAPLRVPRSPHIRCVQVAGGFDVADNYIAEQVQANDVVVTADIPLAAAVIERGGAALNPRGERYTTDTIRQRLTMRDFMDTLRASGIDTGGPPPLHARDLHAFAAQLDRLLSRRNCFPEGRREPG